MSNQQLFIPTLCKVGSQMREGTYTGKLGYVIYRDGKVWRKETSWESWRHKEGQGIGWRGDGEKAVGVEPVEFANVPTEGFVLNKKAGGYSTGWNHRQTYCRVYDPRGWEIEITIPNLLFILEECSAFKGKGLEGEFVYSWDGKDLVLLPVSSSDYIACTQYTKLQSQKIGKKDLKEGCTYLTSKQVELIYVGRYDAYLNQNYCPSELYVYRRSSDPSELNRPTKTHVFATIDMDRENKERISFTFLSGLTSIKAKVSDECHSRFSEIVDVYHNHSIYSSKAKEIIIRNIEDSSISAIFFVNEWAHTLYLKSAFDSSNYREGVSSRQISKNDDGSFKVVNDYNRQRSYDFFSSRNSSAPEVKIVTKEELIRDYGLLSRLYENGYTQKI